MPERIDLQHPHPLFDAAATRRIEQAAAAALPPHALMQRAGLALARLALALAPHARTVWIACGPGNNGGDGLEAAMHLMRWGAHPLVTWLGEKARAPADALASLARARAAGVPFTGAPPPDLCPQDLCIDALLGIGAARAPSGRMAEWLRLMRAAKATLLAVDVPSGLNADTGAWLPAHPGPEMPDATDSIAHNQDTTLVNAQNGSQNAGRHTLTLLTVKPGLFTAHGRDACGTLWFDDLGTAPANEPPAAWLNAPPPLPPRPHASHKGSWGDVAIIGGETWPPHSPAAHGALPPEGALAALGRPGGGEGGHAHGLSMTGAALLAASAALHGGAGRVYVSLLGQDTPMFDACQPELMFRRPDALDLARLTAVCGCGGGSAVQGVLPAVLEQTPRLVLDADALNAIAHDLALQRALRQRAARGQATVLTPHPLEAARLLDCGVADVQERRLYAAQKLAARWQCVAVLKGSGSIIAAPGLPPHINPTGNALLATPGAGDVLAGLIGAHLAAGHPAFEAACRAVRQHGATADAWPPGATLTAGQLARRLA
ncbi:MAG: NAD(P)H-hydrate dehydratase [Burkholderiaceae bacterium]|jgi:hydroxyethylthiazole kinase-like uncharacterized protein yjeF|nr:NAD(P)H-hydrate dehydratase [Burkholderiaceae bacterium]